MMTIGVEGARASLCLDNNFGGGGILAHVAPIFAWAIEVPSSRNVGILRSSALSESLKGGMMTIGAEAAR